MVGLMFDKESLSYAAIYRLYVRGKLNRGGVKRAFSKRKLKDPETMIAIWSTTSEYKQHNQWPKKT
jgi:hypothetical protein